MNYKFVFHILNQILIDSMEDLNSKKIVEVIKNLRGSSKKRTGEKITQRKMAEILDIGLRQYQKYESGISELNLTQFFTICRTLKVSPIEVFLTAFPGLEIPEGSTLKDKIMQLDKLVKEISQISDKEE